MHWTVQKEFTIVTVIAIIFFTGSVHAITLGSGTTLSNGTIIMLTGINANITIIGDYEVDGLEVYGSYMLLNVSSAPVYTSLSSSYSSGVLNITATSGSAPSLFFNSNIPEANSCTADSQCISGHCIHSVCRNALTYCGDRFCDVGESWCLTDCGFSGCDYSFNVTYPKTMSAKINETAVFEVAISSTGTCSIRPVTLIVSGLPEGWIEIEPASSGYLNNRKPFTFNLSVLPLAAGDYNTMLSLEGGISKNYSSMLTAVGGNVNGCSCPAPEEWTVCVNGTQERTVYACDGSSCIASSETRQCGNVPYGLILPIAIASAALAIAATHVLRKGRVKHHGIQRRK